MRKRILVLSIASISVLAVLAEARKSGSKEIVPAASASKSEFVIAKPPKKRTQLRTIATLVNWS